MQFHSHEKVNAHVIFKLIVILDLVLPFNIFHMLYFILLHLKLKKVLIIIKINKLSVILVIGTIHYLSSMDDKIAKI